MIFTLKQEQLRGIAALVEPVTGKYEHIQHRYYEIAGRPRDTYGLTNALPQNGTAGVEVYEGNGPGPARLAPICGCCISGAAYIYGIEEFEHRLPHSKRNQRHLYSERSNYALDFMRSLVSVFNEAYPAEYNWMHIATVNDNCASYDELAILREAVRKLPAIHEPLLPILKRIHDEREQDRANDKSEDTGLAGLD